MTFHDLRRLFESVLRRLPTGDCTIGDRVCHDVTWYSRVEWRLDHNPTSCTTCKPVSAPCTNTNVVSICRKRKFSEDGSEEAGTSAGGLPMGNGRASKRNRPDVANSDRKRKFCEAGNEETNSSEECSLVSSRRTSKRKRVDQQPACALRSTSGENGPHGQEQIFTNTRATSKTKPSSQSSDGRNTTTKKFDNKTKCQQATIRQVQNTYCKPISRSFGLSLP